MESTEAANSGANSSGMDDSTTPLLDASAVTPLPSEPPESGGVRTDLDLWSAKTRELLSKHDCASCHKSSRPTRNPRALAVFDLDEELWARRMSPDQLESLGRRVAGSAAFDGEEKDTVARFLAEQLEKQRSTRSE